MVRDSRIKDTIFSQTINAAATTGSAVTDEVVNGEILEVDWAFNRTGSIFITNARTGEEYFRRNAPSGTGTQVTRPATFTQDGTTGSIANARHVSYVNREPLVLNFAGAASGTQALTVHVRYR